MLNKMLIDASHQEETRVVVVRGNQIEEFDFESEHKKQLKGNIYLARIIRVEPSLQAAFIEYGGNRHGFLAFNEIHPDYYQIPVADRIALLEAEARTASEDNEEENHDDLSSYSAQAATDSNPIGYENDSDRTGHENLTTDVLDEKIHVINKDIVDLSEETDIVESVGAEDVLEEVPRHRHSHRRQYKIQEVIKRRQILLVQVVKEERGNKGAALTTYLSLAGRYSVLMPNTARGGGISRKITNLQDRKRLKDIVKELKVPQGMGVILRTAGANRTKAEIKRDYEYLMRLWENIRTLTLQSTAPALVYEEGSLIKRSIRDLYNKDIEEILVAGDTGYHEAKEFMRMLMPSHAKAVQPYREQVPIFARNGIEAQLDRMLQPQVILTSGGYIIINQTEALVAIDVNSGRATREHSIEDTALQTNLEAAEEVARQLRLRDLAGLIVIDFIDMEEKGNNRAVEKKLKDCLKNDRARIQIGCISHFGLLEMSRQRIRASVLESTTQPCPHCSGTGHIRSASSVALYVIRSIEEYLLRHSQHNIIVHTPIATALYVLNHKRQTLSDLETRFGLMINIEGNDAIGSQHLIINKGTLVSNPVNIPPVPQLDLPTTKDSIEDFPIAIEEVETESETQTNKLKQEVSDEDGRRRRRKRRRRNGRDYNAIETITTAVENISISQKTDENNDRIRPDLSPAINKEEHGKNRRRGGRRNYRKHDKANDNALLPSGNDNSEVIIAEPIEMKPTTIPTDTGKSDGKSIKKSTHHRIERSTKTAREIIAEIAPEDLSETKSITLTSIKPIRKNHKKAQIFEKTAKSDAASKDKDGEETSRATEKKEKIATSPPKLTTPIVTSNTSDDDTQPKAKRSGWWQKRGFF